MCEEMKGVVGPLVRTIGGTLEVVDVDSDPALAARWGNEIPVLLDAEGRVVAKARDAPEKIAKLLAVSPGERTERGACRRRKWLCACCALVLGGSSANPGPRSNFADPAWCLSGRPRRVFRRAGLTNQ